MMSFGVQPAIFRLRDAEKSDDALNAACYAGAVLVLVLSLLLCGLTWGLLEVFGTDAVPWLGGAALVYLLWWTYIPEPRPTSALPPHPQASEIGSRLAAAGEEAYGTPSLIPELADLRFPWEAESPNSTRLLRAVRVQRIERSVGRCVIGDALVFDPLSAERTVQTIAVFADVFAGDAAFTIAPRRAAETLFPIELDLCRVEDPSQAARFQAAYACESEARRDSSLREVLLPISSAVQEFLLEQPGWFVRYSAGKLLVMRIGVRCADVEERARMLAHGEELVGRLVEAARAKTCVPLKLPALSRYQAFATALGLLAMMLVLVGQFSALLGWLARSLGEVGWDWRQGALLGMRAALLVVVFGSLREVYVSRRRLTQRPQVSDDRVPEATQSDAPVPAPE